MKMIHGDNIITLTLPNQCIATNADDIKAQIFPLIDGPYKHICLDFSETNHVDAAGIGAIAAAIFQARRKGHLFSMKGANGQVLDILIATGVDRLLSSSRE
ncbi:STAS domain-containing protein [Sporomusa aerivorans]|uniref:STAS domain-containing protein n=1 Tax=Sporomusa aerivorans TaxID=204936 RepID=UPI00352B40B4